MSSVVTRFAPSPTGELHIGGARTALFNWLYARRNRGRFILRIEDTDRERSTEGFVHAILDGMTWLGLAWDEGPLYQTDRLALYQKEASRLLSGGKAYRCVCAPDDLERRRDGMKARKEKPRYDGRCRNLPPDATEGKPSVVRFKAPSSGRTVVRDLLRGDVTFDNSELDDLVILRTDGTPTYNFVVVVDDASMGITHVLRGDDHLNNTPKQLLIYEALGYPVPRIGHFPLIHGMEGGKMSKRDAETSVIKYREMGYLPEAVVNYLARLGWGHGDKEIFSIGELQDLFSLEHVNLSPSRFDINKLLHLNAHYIKEAENGRLAGLLIPFLKARGIDATPSPWLERAVSTLKERSRTMAEMADAAEYYFREKETDPKAAAKFLTPEVGPVLEEIAAAFSALQDFTPAATEAKLREIVGKGGGAVKIHQPIRVALTGGTASPGLFDVMDVLGREEVARRLLKAAKRIGSA